MHPKMTRHAVPNPVRLPYTDTCCAPPPLQSADASHSRAAKLLEICLSAEEKTELYLEIAGDGWCVFICRLNSVTGNLSEERMTRLFEDGC